jgi:WD40 repeat protein
MNTRKWHVQILAVASDSGRIKVYNSLTGEGIVELAGHEDAAQSVLWDPASAYLVTCSSDNTFRLWS